MIQLLLSRGANPNICTNPVHPLVYTVLTGDLLITGRLLECGANANHILPDEVIKMPPPPLLPPNIDLGCELMNGTIVTMPLNTVTVGRLFSLAPCHKEGDHQYSRHGEDPPPTWSQP